MNTIRTITAPTSVTTAAPKFTTTEREQIEAIQAELARLAERLESIVYLRNEIEAAGRRFAMGELGMIEAAALASRTTAERAEMAGWLRSSVKAVQREVLESAAPFVEKARKHHVDELAEKCRVMEARERENAAAIGIHDDEFRPSGLLESLREQHRRALATIGQPVNRSDLAGL